MNPTHPNSSNLNLGNNKTNKSTKAGVSKVSGSGSKDHKALFHGNAKGKHGSSDYGIAGHLSNQTVPQQNSAVPSTPGGATPYV